MSARAWSGKQVRESFNAIPSVLYYTRAAHFLGLWESERILIERHLPGRADRHTRGGLRRGPRDDWPLEARLQEDHAPSTSQDELLDQAQSLANEKGANSIEFNVADATRIDASAFAGTPPGGSGPRSSCSTG